MVDATISDVHDIPGVGLLAILLEIILYILRQMTIYLKLSIIMGG